MVILWLLIIGAVWGTTNALIKRGALKAQEKQIKREKEKEMLRKPSSSSSNSSSSEKFWLFEFVANWFHLLCVWEYSIPFLVNLSASVVFLKQLGDSPINIAVPVTNATTFAMTAIAGAALGESIDVVKGLTGVGLIVLGIALCISPDVMNKYYKP